ncbi:hypothetical protein [Natronosalvus rutilus]|uniref:Uncharacterized protein n=1 Tax=Natronosalvus rutilus TaxID=2953753 RepID=A0A9E7SXA3_9EURY|nr:hypothetical protein [Natronosalvus rutilus]UTF55962.1 hypothetical protein NGM29_20945 [Natronosalvus rutilus]
MNGTTTKRLEDRTTEFMHALAAADVDAANISADRSGAGMMVHTWLPEADLEAAEEIAGDHGFELYGETLTELKAKYNRAAADQGRKRYRFEAEEGA